MGGEISTSANTLEVSKAMTDLILEIRKEQVLFKNCSFCFPQASQ